MWHLPCCPPLSPPPLFLTPALLCPRTSFLYFLSLLYAAVSGGSLFVLCTPPLLCFALLSSKGLVSFAFVLAFLRVMVHKRCRENEAPGSGSQTQHITPVPGLDVGDFQHQNALGQHQHQQMQHQHQHNLAHANPNNTGGSAEDEHLLTRQFKRLHTGVAPVWTDPVSVQSQHNKLDAARHMQPQPRPTQTPTQHNACCSYETINAMLGRLHVERESRQGRQKQAQPF